MECLSSWVSFCIVCGQKLRKARQAVGDPCELRARIAKVGFRTHRYFCRLIFLFFYTVMSRSSSRPVLPQHGCHFSLDGFAADQIIRSSPLLTTNQLWCSWQEKPNILIMPWQSKPARKKKTINVLSNYSNSNLIRFSLHRFRLFEL